MLLMSCIQSDTSFLEYVLSDFDRYSFYVAIKVKSDQRQGVLIIENNELYCSLKQTKGFSQEHYKTVIKRYIVKGIELEVDSSVILKGTFLEKNNLIQLKNNKAKRCFVDDYLTGGVLKKGLSTQESAFVIYQLFKLEIPVKIDCETGFLYTHSFEEFDSIPR